MSANWADALNEKPGITSGLGYINFIHRVDGYGFVTPDEGGRSVYIPARFAHGFFVGQRVCYRAVQGPKSPVVT
jgi:cold shock CspA family protein